MVQALRHIGFEAEATQDPISWVQQRADPSMIITVVDDEAWPQLEALARVPRVRTIALLDDDDTAACVAALRAGVAAVLPREAKATEITIAVEATVRGLAILPAAVVHDLALGAASPAVTAQEEGVLGRIVSGGAGGTMPSRNTPDDTVSVVRGLLKRLTAHTRTRRHR